MIHADAYQWTAIRAICDIMSAIAPARGEMEMSVSIALDRSSPLIIIHQTVTLVPAHPLMSGAGRMSCNSVHFEFGRVIYTSTFYLYLYESLSKTIALQDPPSAVTFKNLHKLPLHTEWKPLPIMHQSCVSLCPREECKNKCLTYYVCRLFDEEIY